MRLVSEQCSVLSVNALQTAIRKIINKNYSGATEDEVFKYTQEELEKFTVNNQKFEYTHLPNRLGGYRWFFSCGKCKGRVSKLFLPPEGVPGYEHQYWCKECHGLHNESVMKANNNIYKKVVKPLKRLREIEEKLEKGHLMKDKVQELLNEYDELEKQMKDTQEYRLYAFKKKRGIKIF
jgi:hypothetical protein